MGGISARSLLGSAGVDGLHPRIAAATRAQLDARRVLLDAGAGHVGWKIALGIAEVEELIGTEPWSAT